MLVNYQFPLWFVVLWFGSAVLLRRRRDLGRDGRALLRRRQPLVQGIEYVPQSGPCIVVMNHYERSGLRVWWCALLVTAALSNRRGGDLPMCWLITDRFEGFRMCGVRFPDRLMAWLLSRIASVYGLLMVARPEGEAVSRSLVLRKARQKLRGGMALGITPEAANGDGRQLARPWPGSSAALGWLSGGEVPLVPVAVFDDGQGRLVSNFGEPFRLVRMGDEGASEIVMAAIAELLPDDLSGSYRADIT